MPSLLPSHSIPFVNNAHAPSVTPTEVMNNSV
jgi:hypothetical protein